MKKKRQKSHYSLRLSKSCVNKLKIVANVRVNNNNKKNETEKRKSREDVKKN